MPRAYSDYPRIREQHTCPRCLHSKPQGNVVCWPCHRQLTKRYDYTYGPFEADLIRIEATIATPPQTIRALAR